MEIDPLFLSAMIGRVADRAQVPYETARECILAGMDEWEAIRWLEYGRRSGKPASEVIAAWRQRRLQGRRRTG